MPQMNKGGKWVFGWCVVGTDKDVRIPPEAFIEYSFQAGELVVFLRGSHRLGGFSVGRLEKLAGPDGPMLRHSLGQGIIQTEGRIALPPDSDIQLGERLLAVRGSGYAVAFITGGPIYAEALKRPEIETFPIL